MPVTSRQIDLPDTLRIGEQVTLLPEAIRAWRRERALSQAALSVKAGCSEGLISTIEAGHRQASIVVALRIAEALEVPLPAIGLVHIDLSALSPIEAA